MNNLFIEPTTREYKQVPKSHTSGKQKPLIFPAPQNQRPTVILVVSSTAGLPYTLASENLASDGDTMVKLTAHSAPQKELIPNELYHLAVLPRQELVELALQAQGNWKTGETQETATEIVRRLRNEWQ